MILKMGEHPTAGNVPSLASVILWFFSWITVDDAKGYVSIGAGIAAFVCAALGGYSHILNILEKRRNKKNNYL